MLCFLLADLLGVLDLDLAHRPTDLRRFLRNSGERVREKPSENEPMEGCFLICKEDPIPSEELYDSFNELEKAFQRHQLLDPPKLPFDTSVGAETLSFAITMSIDQQLSMISEQMKLLQEQKVWIDERLADLNTQVSNLLGISAQNKHPLKKRAICSKDFVNKRIHFP